MTIKLKQYFETASGTGVLSTADGGGEGGRGDLLDAPRGWTTGPWPSSCGSG